MPRFSDALDRAAETIKRPAAIPAGHYVFQNGPQNSMRPTKNGDYEVVSMPALVVEPMDTIDADALAAFGKVTGQTVRNEIMFPTDEEAKSAYEQALFRLKAFCTNCGVDTSDGTTPKQWLANLPGTRFIGEVTHRVDKNDPEIVYAQMGRTAELA